MNENLTYHNGRNIVDAKAQVPRGERRYHIQEIFFSRVVPFI